MSVVGYFTGVFEIKFYMQIFMNIDFLLTGPISFRAVSSWVRAEPGRSSLLECVVREPVEECLWMHQLSETQKLQEFTRFEPANFNNCSFNLPETEEGTSSGWWVCGARSPGDVNFTMASPTRVEFVERGQLNPGVCFIRIDKK